MEVIQLSSDVVYFSINNWFRGRDYPPLKFLIDHMYDFSSDEWCKQNQLCVNVMQIDMSVNWCISASLRWVEQHLPELLTDESYSYKILTHTWDSETHSPVDRESVHFKKYADFVFHPDSEDDDDYVEDHFGVPFQQYCSRNFGVQYIEEDSSDDPDEDSSDDPDEDSSDDPDE